MTNWISKITFYHSDQLAEAIGQLIPQIRFVIRSKHKMFGSFTARFFSQQKATEMMGVAGSGTKAKIGRRLINFGTIGVTIEH